jgi:DNA-binding CsgD family transcriptional regulator
VAKEFGSGEDQKVIPDGVFEISYGDASALYPDAPTQLLREYARREAELFQTAVTHPPGWSWQRFDRDSWDLETWLHNELGVLRNEESQVERVKLSLREQRLLTMLQQGYTSTQIAEELHVQRLSAMTQITRLRLKLRRGRLSHRSRPEDVGA